VDSLEVSPDCPLRDFKAELHEFAVNPRCAPERIFVGHLANQSGDLPRDPGASGFPGPRLPTPVAAEAGAVPPDHGVGLHDDQARLPTVEESEHNYPEPTIATLELWSFALTMEHGELLPQCQVLRQQARTRDEEDPINESGDSKHCNFPLGPIVFDYWSRVEVGS